MAVLLGIVCGKYCLKITSQRTEIYKRGFAAKNIFGQISGRDADRRSVSRSLACGALAEEWAKTLDRQNEVVWLEKDSNPLPRIRKDGIRIADGTGSDGFIPLTQLRYEDVYGLKVDILNSDRKVLTISSGVKNFFVGETLITNVLRKQQAAFGATNG